jgi:hypothetical protein
VTDYFVRKSGLDTNDGLTAGAAFLTIDKAANTVAAGDTVYVGAGTYRELVTMDTAGTSGNQITYIGDIDGENTGDAGLVIISAHATEQSVATRASCIDADATGIFEYTTFRGFVFVGGTVAAIDAHGSGNNNFEGVVIEDCTFASGHLATDLALYVDFNDATAPSPGMRIRRCVFSGLGVHFQYNENATAEVGMDVLVESCLFVGSAMNSVSTGINWDKQVPDTHPKSGLSVHNCTFFGTRYGVIVDTVTTAFVTAASVENCIFHGGQFALYCSAAAKNPIASDYNTMTHTNTPYTNVTAGGNDRANTADAGLIGGIHDIGLIQAWGWSPYRPFEPIRQEDPSGSGVYEHHAVVDGDATNSPAFGLYNEDRPMGGTAVAAADDRGAVEARARPEQETTTVDTGSNAVRFEGAGFHDFLVPVDASALTITIRARFDGTYAGTLPSMSILNIPGVADITDTMTAAANTWETLTSGSFTPTSQGVARVRVKSEDTSAGGECFFDTLAVS